MKLRVVVTLLLLLLFAVFVAVNWSAFLAPASLSLLFTTIEAPLGVILLCVLAAVAGVFVAYMAYWQGTVLLETRRHTKELQSQRELADKAEASRFTELQTRLLAEFGKLDARLANTESQIAAQVSANAAGLRTELQQTGNSLAAYIGELDDRLGRQPAAPGAIRPV